tara:strand:- start:176 stop:466 length:291 start_codon:yes stop_codon:yes gene_type:complete
MKKLKIINDIVRGKKYINKNAVLDFIEKCCYPYPMDESTSEEDHFIGNIHLAIESLYEARIERDFTEIKHLEMEIENYKELLQEAYNKGYKPDYLK